MWSGTSSLGRATRPSGKSGKSRTSGAIGGAYRREPSAPAARTAGDAHGDRLVPARPARARPSGAHRGAPRARTGSCPCSCSTRGCSTAAASRPRTARGSCSRRCASCAARCATAAASSYVRAGPAGGGAAARWPRETGAEAVYFASDVSPFAMARDRRVVAALGGVRAVRAPGQLRRRRRRPADAATAGRTPSSARSGARGSSCRGATCTARRARSACRPGSPPARSRTAPEPEAAEPFAPGEAAARERLSRWLAGGDRALRRAPRPARGRDVASSRPTCTSAASRRARPRRGRGPRAARAPRRSCASSPGATSTRTCCCTTPATPRGAYRRAYDALEWEDDDDALRRLARGPHRLSRRRRRHAPARPPGLDAQPRAADRRLLPHQGPAPRLARRRGALHAPPAVRRRGAEQRQLAVDHVDRGRSRRRTSAASTTRSPSSAATTRTAPTCAAGAPSCATSRSRKLAEPWTMSEARAGGRRAA